jgi:Tol biopolymer transport system component
MKTARPLLIALLAALALPGAAVADPDGTTLLESRTDGLAAFPAGIVNDSTAATYGISADGCRVVFTSSADGLLGPGYQNDEVQSVFVRDACADTVEDVTKGGSIGPANADSERPSISRNGRYVAFVSKASNLGAGAVGTAVYLRDLQADTIKLVSRRTGATGPPAAPFAFDPPAVSDTGAVAFQTNESLVAGDTNGVSDVYVRDGDTTTLVSAGITASAMAPSISADGRKVAFGTGVKLTVDDSNAADDVYVRDLDSGAYTLISRADGAGAAAAGGEQGRISGDGSAVAFSTRAGLDAAKDANRTMDVYRREGDATTLVSRRTGADTVAGDVQSYLPSIDQTGDVIAFQSEANDLGNEGSTWDTDVFVRDLAQSTTTMLSRIGTSGAPADGVSRVVSVSATHAAFETTSTTLLSGDDDDFTRVVRRRLPDAATELASRPAGTGAFAGGGTNEATFGGTGNADGRVSADGRYVAFLSKSDSLSSDDNDRVLNAFVRDNRTDTTILVNRGDAEQVDPQGARELSLSDDGRRVAFTTQSRLDPSDNDGMADVYVRDIVAGTTYLASRKTGAATVVSGSDAAEPSMSADGTRVAFTATASLDAADANGGVRDVYVRDLGTHETFLGSTAAAAPALSPSLDADGSRVAFQTGAAIDAADANNLSDVYRRDLPTGATVLVSRAHNGQDTAIGNGHSHSPSISADGTRVAFASQASNFGNGDTTPRSAIHVRDIPDGKTILASRESGGGAESNGLSDRPSLSADGTKVVFESDATNLGIANPNGTQVYWRDVQYNATRVASLSTAGFGGSANRPAIRPALSANGHCVAFTSRAGNLSPAHAGGDFTQVYLHALTADCPDERAPQTTVDGPTGTILGNTPTFTLTADESPATFECRVDGGDWSPCASPKTLPAQADGSHTFAVRAADAAGNVDATPATAEFVVDTDPPETVLEGPSGRVGTDDVTFELGADEDDVRYICETDGEGWEDCDPPSRTLEDLPEGDHTFTVAAIDGAGNQDPTPATTAFTVDLTAPALTIGAITAADDGTARVEFTTDGAATCAVDGAALAPCTSPLLLTGLAAGAHTVRVQAVDDVGNAGAVVEKAFTVPAKPTTPREEPREQPREEPREEPRQEPTGGDQQPEARGPAPIVPAGTKSARLAGTSVKVDRRGYAVLKLVCGDAPCKGTAVLRGKVGRKPVVLARGSYAIGAGGTATLRLRVGPAGRRALKAKRLKAATVELGGGPAKLKLRAAR